MLFWLIKGEIMMKRSRLSQVAIIFAIMLASFLLGMSLFSFKNTLRKDTAIMASSGFKNVENISGAYSSIKAFKSGIVYKTTGNANFNAGIYVTGTAVLYIPSGYTVNVTGTTGNAGIRVENSNTLIIVGDGSLNVKGGNAGNGVSGSKGENGYLNPNANGGDGEFRSGAGGKGGKGGSGAGAAIGGDGGRGGDGGYGGSATSTYRCDKGND